MVTPSGIDLRQEWDRVPAIKVLDGLLVKLPGFVGRWRATGAKWSPLSWCRITVPALRCRNPTVYATLHGGGEVRGLFDTVWVTGELRVVAQAGYTIEALKVKPYD